MSDAADMFKKLAQNRQKSTSVATETETRAEIKSSPKPNTKTTAKKTVPKTIPAENSATASKTEPTKKRGRPATGKRSDPDWIGRTYYIRKETDFDIEDELIALKRKGINLDKSELVNFLLGAWVKWRKGENIDIQLDEISPRQKDELS